MKNRLHVTLIGSGLGIWAIGLCVLAFLWLYDRPQFGAALATFGAFLLTGKIPAILAGYALGGEWWLVGICVLIPDVGSVLVMYPFTHHGLNFLGRFSGFLEDRIAAARAKAARQEGIVSRRGSLGLLALTMLPGGLHSPLVVMVVGQLAGLSDLQVLMPIVGAQIVMVSIYTVAIFAGLDLAGTIDPRIPWAISLTIVAILLGLTLRNWRRWRKRKALEAVQSSPAAAVVAPEPPPRS